MWVLIFCAHVYSGITCTAPAPFRTREACAAVGKGMLALADKTYPYALDRNAQCIFVLDKPKTAA